MARGSCAKNNSICEIFWENNIKAGGGMKARKTVWMILCVLVLMAGCNVPEQSLNPNQWGHEWDSLSNAEGPLENDLEIPVHLVEGSLILVPVSHQGTSYLFLLDTGSVSSLFGPRLRGMLGEPLGNATFAAAGGKQVTVEIFPPPKAFLGEIDLRDGGPVGYVNFEFARDYGIPCDGVIGMSVLRRYVVQIDYPNSLVRIMNSDDKEHPEWGTSMAMYCSKSHILSPAIRAEFGKDFPIQIMLDTGAIGMGSLDPWAMKMACNGKPVFGPDTVSVGLGGLSYNRQFVVPELRLGKFVYNNLLFEESACPIIGSGLLSRHKVTFDFPNKRLYLSDPSDPPEYFLPFRTGIRVRRESSKLVSYYVAPDSPAQKAGVLAGDVILRIDHKEVKDLSVWEAKELLRSDLSKKVRLKLQRDQYTLDITVVLEKPSRYSVSP